MKECPDCNLCFDDSYNRCPHDGEGLFISYKCGTSLSDRYILERRLGKGGMATVFRAKHKLLKSLHAIKIISPEVVKEDQTLLVRFRQEAILAASIHHPNVVNVTDFGVENGDLPFLVMEYIEGVTLDDFLRKEKRLSPAKALEILTPIALGVGEAHKKGITHRDLKPLNVMLRNGIPLAQAVKVLDFGLAKIKSTESFASLVQAKTTSLLGSPQYMSPEQWANEDIDTRADIYSMGIILFQMLTGDVPFHGDSIPTIMYQHLQVTLPSLASFGVSVSPRLESVIQKALAKKQDERHKTAEEFLSEFRNALSSTNQTNISLSYDNITDSSQADDTSVIYNQSGRTEKYTNTDFGKTYKLPYLSRIQNETLSSYFNQPKLAESEETKKLTVEFIEAQNRVEEARSKVSEAEKLAQDYNEAEKAAEEARHKVLQARRKLEEDVRFRMQAEMEGKLAVEREARAKAEAEARHLMAEAKARKEAEERANALAKTALQAQQQAEEAQKKAQREIQQRQLEEGTRRKAEEEALKLAGDVAEAKKRYEEAKKEAENEEKLRFEAEIKYKKIEEDIRRIEQYEAERRIVEEQGAQQIKEQAEHLEKQALEAQQKVNSARLLAESEIQKREQAETARVKAEEEVRRLAEEIIKAQLQLEEAQQLAKSESEKRVLEEEARKKAEAIARSSSANQDNEENSDKILQVQTFKDNPVQHSFPTLERGTMSGSEKLSSEQILINTSSPDVSNTGQISRRKISSPLFYLAGLFAFLLVGGFGSYLIYNFLSNSSNIENASSNSKDGNANAQISRQPADRLTEKMVLITGGTFQMGREDVKPQVENYGVQFPAHKVEVSDFYIDRTEVSNKEYAEFLQATKAKAPENWQNGKPPPGQENYPVTFVSNSDARNFAEWISERNKIRCQLPTEEEWEYAARSGSQQYIYPWGNEWIPNRANIATLMLKEVGTTQDETAVGGIKDMMGNVMEWTSSTYDYYPGYTGLKDPNIKLNFFPTPRGSSFAASEDIIKDHKFLLTSRQALPGDQKLVYLGFRLACRPK